MKRILYFFNKYKDSDYKLSTEIISFLRTFNCIIYCENEDFANLSNLEVYNKQDLDLVILLGGDGTVLRYLRKYNNPNIPLLGINLGRVGALNVASLDNYQELFVKYFNGEFYNVEYLNLEGSINYSNGEVVKFNIYNDVVIHRGLSMKPLLLKVSVNDGLEDFIYCDGLIVATPTGSTAYNHSAGGPILAQNCGCFVVTPICPQTKGFASNVISENDQINIKIDNPLDGINLCVDGHENYPIKDNVIVSVKKASKKLVLVQFDKDIRLYKLIYKVIDSINK